MPTRPYLVIVTHHLQAQHVPLNPANASLSIYHSKGLRAQLKVRETEYLRECYDADVLDDQQSDADLDVALDSIRESRREAEEHLLEAGV